MRLSETPAFSRLPTRLLFAYALPAVPLAGAGIPLFIYLPSFYTQSVGLNLSTVGVVLMLVRLWDVLTDPLIGYLSDRTPGRFGRRRPWLVAGTPPTIVAVLMLFMPPGGVGAWYLFGWMIVLYLGWTMLTLPYQSWGAEISDEYHQRTRIAAFREGGVLLGTLLATGLPLLFPAASAADAGAAALGVMAWAILLSLPPAVLAAVACVEDRPSTTPANLPWRDRWAALAGNRPFRRLLVAYLVNGTANGLPATLFVLFVGFVLEAPGWTPLLLFVYFISGLAAVPFWLRLSYRFGKHRTWAAAMLWVSAVFACAPFLGTGDVWAFVAICILSGVGLGADLVLPTAMQADVIDIDAAATGEQPTGLYFAVWGMATKLALALAVGIAFPVLDGFGFSAVGTSPPGAVLALAILYGLLPLPFKLAAAAMVWNFPLDASAQQRLRQGLARRS